MNTNRHPSPDANKTFNIMLSYKFDTVLDIGCGGCKYSEMFIQAGKKVTATDYVANKPYVVAAEYLDHPFEPHDAVWCSHVLEHQVDVQSFLHKMIRECKEGGVIAINVPPLKHQIVGGHVSLWNTGLLLYNLVLAGLDLSKARVGTYGYNCSVVTEKISIPVMPPLTSCSDDFISLAKYFPMAVPQGFDGSNINIRWN